MSCAGLQDRGLVTRPATAPQGRALPTQLTDAGHERLHAASTAVRAVEKQMLTTLTPHDQAQLCDNLTSCAAALTHHSPETPADHDREHRARPGRQ